MVIINYYRMVIINYYRPKLINERSLPSEVASEGEPSVHAYYPQNNRFKHEATVTHVLNCQMQSHLRWLVVSALWQNVTQVATWYLQGF